MKIGIIGLNANASYFAMKLSEKNEVFGIDNRKEKVDSINKDGVLIEKDDKQINFKYNAYLSGEVSEKMDAVLLFVKSTQLMSALSLNEKILRDDTLVISFQNGIGNERDISRFTDLHNIVISVTEINCYNKDNIIKFSGNKLMHVASPANDKKTLLKAKLLFDQSGYECEFEDDLNTMVWKKLMLNITLNPLCAIFDCKIKTDYENKYLWDIAKSVIYEACEIAKLDNVNLKYDDMVEYVRKTVYSIAKSYPSMHRDIEKKRFTEIDKLNGAIVNLAYKNRYKVPYNEFIVNAIKAMEKLYS